MDTPRIFLYQEHVDELYHEFIGSGVTQERVALGMALDDGEVFHVYLSPPRAHFAGQPCKALVRFVHGLPPEGSPPELAWDHGVGLVVTLGLAGERVEARGHVLADQVPVRSSVHFVPVKAEIYARSKGLIEVDVLTRKSAAVVGLGSGGSAIALALAQAGIGRLILVDRDRLELGNVSRHACGVGDLGRRKTNAMRDLVLGKNPYLDVVTHCIDVNEEPAALRRAIHGSDLLIAATDGDASRFLLNQIALDLDTPAIFGRVLTRAAGGDVLRVRPHAGPCLACVYTEQFLKQRPREYSRMAELREDEAAYVPEGSLETKIQVGLASDITPIANLMVKLALVELSRGTWGGLETLDADLKADFYVWANRREGVYAAWPAMGFSFNQPAILRWYGADIRQRSDCGACGSTQGAVDAGYFGS